MEKKKTLPLILIIGGKTKKALKWIQSIENKIQQVKYHVAQDFESAQKFLSKNKVDIVMADNDHQLIEAMCKNDKALREDDLTGLLNRVSVISQLKHAVDYAKRYNILCAVLYIDLDNFKPINDTLGRHEGDKLLQEVAMRIRRVIRKADLFARVGGDEFVVILTHIKQVVDAGRVASKINESLKFPFNLQGKDYYITSSIGIAIYPNDNTDSETLIQYADMAMSSVKRKGKETYQYYKAELNKMVEKNIRLSNDLHTAIELKQLNVNFQPLIQVSKNTIIGIEILIRWQHAEFGEIPPSLFIPLAEETGSITLLSEWGLEEACRVCSKLEKKGLSDFYVSVNFSVKDFQQDNFIDKVADRFEKMQVDPHRFVFEVTETVFATEQNEIIKKIQKLKKMGIRIALDDFGTGYSSLNYLRNLPIDIIKIDQTFVQAIESSKKSRHNEMVAMIIDLAKRLGIKTLAEGVETSAQAKFLKETGCEYFQGFLFSKPLNFEEIVEVLKKGKV